MRPSQLFAAVLALSSVSAAWPDALDNVNALADVKNVLYGRQNDDKSSQPTQTPAPKSSAQDKDEKSTDAPKPTSDSKESASASPKPTGSGSQTGKQTGSVKATGTKTTGKPKSTAFDERLPPGGVAMITPAAIAGRQVYKIGDWITFAWNYTSLSVTPSRIDILASCTANQATYTIALNHTVEPTQTFLWDTGAFQASASPPLLTENYKLMIYDAESSFSAPPQAAYLAPFSGLTFGMYQKQNYVPWSEFKCANCNPSAAFSNLELLTFKALLITSGTTVFSLVYFGFSFGLL